MSQPPRLRLPHRFWWIFGSLLGATLVAELAVHPHPRFGLDGTPLFHAWFGLGSCIVMVLVAKLVVGKLLQRPDGDPDA